MLTPQEWPFISAGGELVEHQSESDGLVIVINAGLWSFVPHSFVKSPVKFTPVVPQELFCTLFLFHSSWSLFLGLPCKQTACMHAMLLQSCLTLCDPIDCSPPRSPCPWDFPGKNTGVGCHALLQGISSIQGSNPHLLCLLHRQAGSYH